MLEQLEQLGLKFYSMFYCYCSVNLVFLFSFVEKAFINYSGIIISSRRYFFSSVLHPSIPIDGRVFGFKNHLPPSIVYFLHYPADVAVVSLGMEEVIDAIVIGRKYVWQLIMRTIVHTPLIAEITFIIVGIKSGNDITS